MQDPRPEDPGQGPQTAGSQARPSDPSTLFTLWPEGEPPLEEEVRLALVAAFPDAAKVDDVEVGDEMLWGGVYRMGDGTEVLIWAESRGDISDGFLTEALGLGRELEVARRARWVIGVETFLDGEETQAAFQRQLQVVDVVTVPGVVAVYDENAVVVRSGRLVHDLAWCPVPPRASTIYAIHSVAGRGGTWLHTHGLNRTGLPEIDLLGVPDHAVAEAYDLVDGVVDALLGGLQPDARGRLVIGEDLVLRAVPLDQAIPWFPPDQAGGAEDRQGEMADHAGRRLVLLDTRQDAPPLEAITCVGRRGALYKSRWETARQRRLSRKRWGTFGELFALHRGGSWRFHVKLAYERQTEPETLEHLWFEVLDLRPGRIRGRLVNEPVDVPGLSVGEESWEPLRRLTDWLIITPDGIYDPEVAPALLPD